MQLINETEKIKRILNLNLLTISFKIWLLDPNTPIFIFNLLSLA